MDECTQCGRCCSNLRRGDETTGLTLFPDEKDLFPQDKVRPYLGRGKDAVAVVFTYQHTENVCTHLVDNLCQIYESRPLMCRSFPVKIGAYGLRFSSGCKGVLHTMRKSKTMDREQNEVKAAIEMVERLHEFHTSFQDEDFRWKYNLVTEEWETY